MNRRQFLGGAGAITLVLAGGGIWRSTEQGVFRRARGDAYTPWYDWRESEGTPLALVKAGILAANPHNTQPWAFRVTEDRIALYADRSRHLGSFDPFRREMYLGLGCALENMMQAAGPNGYAASLTVVPGELQLAQPSDGMALVAELKLEAAKITRNSLFEFIERRHTQRGPYRDIRLEAAQRSGLLAQAEDERVGIHLFEGREEREHFGSVVVRATRAIIDDHVMVTDSERWFRHSRRDIEKYRDGPTLDAAGLSPVMTALAKMLPRPDAETNHRYWLDATEKVQVPTAPALGLILVDELYDIEQTLAAGRTWQRMHLWATTQGLAMQPLNQPVERVDREAELGGDPAARRDLEALLPGERCRPTFAFRVGVAESAAWPSPRRSVADTLLEGGVTPSGGGKA
ncbi:Acg family FMN-binding oxidoreductase [Halomonas alkalisoli]|uniref:Acg family FMN-binding oxidoreductase n=1 Tax=Halomonas alkalisoli TaxID=2907158 RepID=UPI001F354A18|nr:twin-arginine translocation signal domain-containing protein [Halomonas alkalisoli]MCE9682754.1 twin-arginine translocation signal domain-containing protein [Halomonas alkalisoli]